ncbi:hypothetical protein EDO6_05306 [Paenibacillus xylanexedens]|nr:hypothetical protein EDO6_05306 [Paenibacillus xylanexedens]
MILPNEITKFLIKKGMVLQRSLLNKMVHSFYKYENALYLDGTLYAM